MRESVICPNKPKFKIGDDVWARANEKAFVGKIAGIKCWAGGGLFSYRVDGANFHPRQYYAENILAVLPF